MFESELLEAIEGVLQRVLAGEIDEDEGIAEIKGIVK
jgi:hypothetical protein